VCIAVISSVCACDLTLALPSLSLSLFSHLAELERRQLSELQHGRLAMLAILELLRHDSQNFVVPAFDGYDRLITGLPFLYKTI
jgi:Chlorophyll A-B binding protein